MTRLQNEADEKRNPRTSATVNQLIDRWLEVLDVEINTRRGYLTKINKHIRPLLGKVRVGRVDAEMLDSFYAELRRCRDHCAGAAKRETQHRTKVDHRCDEHPRKPCEPVDSECKHCRRACKPHVCRPLADNGIRAIHSILSGAYSRGVRWKWVALNPTNDAEPPPMPRPEPDPPSAKDAARIVEEAFARDPDWGAYLWLAMTSGSRRGENCALHWSHMDFEQGVLTVRRALYLDDDGNLREKDTKSHQQRRIVLDPETVLVLREHYARHLERLELLGIRAASDPYMFSRSPDGHTPPRPDTMTQRYDRMVASLGIQTTLHKLRHYSASELLNAGVDIRTVAGRLGHGGGGATTLRVYAAWTSEADQRAAPTLTGRMPVRQSAPANLSPVEVKQPLQRSRGPYQRIANDLRAAIACGAFGPGDLLPSQKDLAWRYRVAVATANRAIAVLAAEGSVTVARGRQARVTGTKSLPYYTE